MAISREHWFELVCRSASAPVSFRGRPLPAFPPETLQINTTGSAGPATLAQAFLFYREVVQRLDGLEAGLRPDSSVLDFGVGWGRILRFFLYDLPPDGIYGIDVEPAFVELCRRLFRSNNFITTAPFPPTVIPDARFELITGYSVFSHLSEAACRAWMQEFHRILRPGGVLALTTRGRNFLDNCEALKSRQVEGYAKALTEIFPDFDAARRAYDAGEFLHSNIPGVSGGGMMNSSFYGETLIPEAYARTAYADWFELVHFICDFETHDQAIMLFRRRGEVGA